MDYINFCFWLQGYFEISNKYSLDDVQVKIIKAHIGLSKQVEKNKPHSFVTWVDGFLQDKEVLSDAEVTLIANKLANCFKHEIDPVYEKNNLKESLNKIHNTGKKVAQGILPSSEKIIFRC